MTWLHGRSIAAARLNREIILGKIKTNAKCRKKSSFHYQNRTKNSDLIFNIF